MRWTAETPDEMIDLALKRAQAGSDALAGLAMASFLDDRGRSGERGQGLDAVASSGSPLADDARWLLARLKPDPKAEAWPGARVFSYDVPASTDGMVTGLAILGPFQDTGAGSIGEKGRRGRGRASPIRTRGTRGGRTRWRGGRCCRRA
ncbi:MAG: hypothetical protein R3B70_25295 [Polyangiaceae bacterium]